MLTLANLRKNKGQAVSVVLMIFLATLFLSLGIVILTGLSDFITQRAEELYTPHVVAIEERNASNNDRFEFLEGFDGVIEMETQMFVGGLGGYYISDVLRGAPMLFVDGTNDGKMNPLTLVGDYLPLVDDAIYLPHRLFLTGGFELGDQVVLDLLGERLEFTVAGSTEDIMFGGHDVRVHVSSEMFLILEAQFPNHHFNLLSTRMNDDADIQALVNDYNHQFFGTIYNVSTFGPPLSYPATQELAQEFQMQIPLVIASLLAGFALVILIVVIIMVRFRITSSIEEGMTNIGTLKAIGYRSQQIITSIVLQFGLLAFIGSLSGMILASFLIAPVASTIEPATGLPWTPVIGLLSIVMTIIGLVSLIILFSYLTTKRISKLHPLIALRGGLATHNFKKNPFSLHHNKGSLVVLLGLKQLLQSKKQVLSIGLISAGLLVASMIGITTYYNINVNTDAFVELMVGSNLPDVMVMVDNDSDGQEAFANLREMEQVAQLYGAEFLPMFADDVLITTTVVADFSYFQNDPLSTGRLPQHDNEIVVGLPALRAMDREVGDWIVIRAGGQEAEYLITGVIQGAEHQGLSAMMTVEGLDHLKPDFIFSQFNLIVAEGVDVADLVEDISDAEDRALISIIDVGALSEVAMDDVEGMFALVTVLILVVTGGIITLVLYMVIKTIIRRRRRELGIQKALGFTTWQLMNQISMSLMPIIVIGTSVGTVIGYIGFNPLFVLLMSGMGVTRTAFTVPLLWTVAVTFGVVLFAYLICLLISWRIRKISAYALVTE